VTLGGLGGLAALANRVEHQQIPELSLDRMNLRLISCIHVLGKRCGTPRVLVLVARKTLEK
jgi:hypothetical protein